MQPKSVTARFEATVNLGDFQNMRPSATVTLDIGEGETFDAVAAEARRLARQQVALELNGLIEQEFELGDINPRWQTPDRAETFVEERTRGHLFEYLKLIAPELAAVFVERARIALQAATEKFEAEKAEQERIRAERAAEVAKGQAELDTPSDDEESDGDDDLDLDEEDDLVVGQDDDNFNDESDDDLF
jgi:hypothetical protein